MRYWVYIFLGLSYSCTQSESSLNLDSPVLIPDMYHPSTDPDFLRVQDTLKYNRELFSGYVFTLAPNGDTLLSTSYLNGLQEGTLKKYYAGRQLREIREYKKGKKNGQQVSYWANSNMRFQFTAVDNAYEGELKEWDVNGNLTHLAHFVNGQEEGVQKTWYANGKLRANYVMRKGKRYGLLGTKNCTNVSDSIFGLQ